MKMATAVRFSVKNTYQTKTLFLVAFSKKVAIFACHLKEKRFF